MAISEYKRSAVAQSIGFSHLFFSVISIFFLATALFYKVTIEAYLEFIDEFDYDYVVLYLACAGVFGIVVHALGGTGVFRNRKVENRAKWSRYLLPIAVATFALFLLELTGGMYSLYAVTHLETVLDFGIKSEMEQYMGDLDSLELLNVMQMSHGCCGSQSYKEWFDVDWVHPDHNDPNLKTGTSIEDVPFSCCNASMRRPCIRKRVHSNTQHFNYDYKMEMSVYTRGCVEALMEEWNKPLLIFEGVIFILVSLGELASAVACRLLQTSIATDPEGGHEDKLANCYVFTAPAKEPAKAPKEQPKRDTNAPTKKETPSPSQQQSQNRDTNAPTKKETPPPSQQKSQPAKVATEKVGRGADAANRVKSTPSPRPNTNQSFHDYINDGVPATTRRSLQEKRDHARQIRKSLESGETFSSMTLEQIEPLLDNAGCSRRSRSDMPSKDNEQRGSGHGQPIDPECSSSDGNECASHVSSRHRSSRHSGEVYEEDEHSPASARHSRPHSKPHQHGEHPDTRQQSDREYGHIELRGKHARFKADPSSDISVDECNSSQRPMLSYIWPRSTNTREQYGTICSVDMHEHREPSPQRGRLFVPNVSPTRQSLLRRKSSHSLIRDTSKPSVDTSVVLEGRRRPTTYPGVRLPISRSPSKSPKKRRPISPLKTSFRPGVSHGCNHALD